MIVDRRQFIIARTGIRPGEFKQLELPCGYVLSYHPELKVTVANENVLLGHAFSCNEDGNLHLADDPVNEMRNWAGRWVLITKDALYMDACGTLGVYYASNDKSGPYLSSSLHLLSEVLGCSWDADYQIKYGDGNGCMDYYPIPYTPYEGIKKMLPTEFYNFNNGGTVEFRKDTFSTERYATSTESELVALFISGMSSVMTNIEREFSGNIWIPLTGGVDSRCNVALATKAGINFSTFTMHRANTKEWDLSRPKKISKALKKNHLVLDDRGISSPEKEHIFNLHCGGPLVVGTEKQQFVADQDVPNAENAIILWGTIWEICERNHWKLAEAACVSERLVSLEKHATDIVTRSNIHCQSLTAWLQFVEEHPMSSMGWTRRFYYEQRIGAWVSAAHQAFDLFDSVRCVPFNCQKLIEIMLSLISENFPDGDEKRAQKEIIAICCPRIAKIPYGEPKTLAYRVIRKICRTFNRR